jgi:hypothetical protein
VHSKTPVIAGESTDHRWVEAARRFPWLRAALTGWRGDHPPLYAQPAARRESLPAGRSADCHGLAALHLATSLCRDRAGLAATALVYASGLAELACAAGLAVPRTRRLAGWATAALFVVVFPANVQMALSSGARSDAYQVGVWARLPVQIPLIVWAASVARRADRG